MYTRKKHHLVRPVSLYSDVNKEQNSCLDVAWLTHLTNPGNFIIIWLSCKYLLWIDSEVRNLATKIGPYQFSLEDETRNVAI